MTMCFVGPGITMRAPRPQMHCFRVARLRLIQTAANGNASCCCVRSGATSAPQTERTAPGMAQRSSGRFDGDVARSSLTGGLWHSRIFAAGAIDRIFSRTFLGIPPVGVYNRLSPLFPLVIDSQIYRDPVNPGVETCLSPKSGQRLVSLDECFVIFAWFGMQDFVSVVSFVFILLLHKVKLIKNWYFLVTN